MLMGNEVTQDISIPVEDIEPEGKICYWPTRKADEIIGTGWDDYLWCGVVSNRSFLERLLIVMKYEGRMGLDLNFGVKRSFWAMSGGLTLAENSLRDNRAVAKEFGGPPFGGDKFPRGERGPLHLGGVGGKGAGATNLGGTQEREGPNWGGRQEAPL